MRSSLALLLLLLASSAWAQTLPSPRQGGTGSSNTATSGRYLKGDGTNFVTSSGSASGTGTCSAGTFVTATNSDAAPTCATPAGFLTAVVLKANFGGL